jgi:hypothetical protein
MKILALTLLSVLPRIGQDGLEKLEKKVADLVGKLADDAIDAREQAVKDLADLGPAAIPVLQKAKTKLDGEVRGRVEEAIKAIEARDTLGRSLPPLKTVTLDHRNRPAKEALEEIARQAGLLVQFEGEVGKEAVSVALKDVPPLQAIDEVCRKHGQLVSRNGGGDDELGGFRHPRAGPVPKLVFTASPFVNFPAAYVRHYRVRVVEVSLTRVNNFQGTQSTGNLQVEIHWPPNVVPKATLKFEITEAKDDKGRSLVPEKKDEEKNVFGQSFRRNGLESESQETFEFKYPEGDATKIASLKGVFVLAYPKEVKTLVFEKPADSKGKSLELHGLKVTLDDYVEKGNEVTVRISTAGKYVGPADAAKRDVDPDFEARLPFSYEDIEPVTVSGAPLGQSGMSGGGGEDNYTYTLTWTAEKPQSLKEIRIPCVLLHHLDEVKFELRDIAFPK